MRYELGKLLRSLRETPLIPFMILVAFIIIGIFGSFLAPFDPNETHFEYALTPPFWLVGGTAEHILGTDELGRDVLSRIICGSGVSLQVGFVVVILAGALGTMVALLSGYLGGWIDTLLMRFTDTVLSMPYLMIAIVLAAVVGPSKNNIILILAVIGWANYARVLRGEVLRLKGREFILLAIVAGCSKTRIMLMHIFPNIINTLLILSTLQLGTVIIAESSLSFLGVGVPPPDPAWGSMVAAGREYISEAWWLATWPGLSILLVVLSCNLIGDWLRVRLDPKFRQV